MSARSRGEQQQQQQQQQRQQRVHLNTQRFLGRFVSSNAPRVRRYDALAAARPDLGDVRSQVTWGVGVRLVVAATSLAVTRCCLSTWTGGGEPGAGGRFLLEWSAVRLGCG